jgi:hypothetical protein
LWINSNTPENSVILGFSIDPYIYYSDRAFFAVSNETDFNNHVNKSDYLVIHAFAEQPKYIQDYITNNQPTPIQAFFSDSEQKQAAVIIYKFS